MSEETCKVCGCTNDKACDGGCWWVAKELCSKCADKLIQENTQLKEQISKTIERLNSKQIRFINEKDYILTDDDLDEIMQIFKINKED